MRRLNLRINGPHIEDVYRKICEIHQLHHGQTPADAEFNYLDQVKKLDAYGVNFHRVMDNAGKDLELGISSDGIRVYHSGMYCVITGVIGVHDMQDRRNRKLFCVLLSQASKLIHFVGAKLQRLLLKESSFSYNYAESW